MTSDSTVTKHCQLEQLCQLRCTSETVTQRCVMQNDKNPKAQLQELIQRQRHPELPTYVKRSVEGPPHALVFTSSVEHASFDREYLGRGSSVKESEANAAMEALRVLRVAEVVEQRALGDWENAARFGVAVLEVLNSAGSVGLPPSVVREALEPDLRPPRGDLERRLRLVPGVGFTRSPDGNSTFYLEAYRNGAPAARSAASASPSGARSKKPVPMPPSGTPDVPGASRNANMSPNMSSSSEQTPLVYALPELTLRPGPGCR